MLKNLANPLVLSLWVTVFASVTMFASLTGVFVLRAEADMVQDGLISYWSLDKDTIKGGTVEDIWGENDGTLEGNPKEIAGKINEALDFDGDDSVDIIGTDSLNFAGKKEMTVAAWVNAGDKEPVIGVVAGCCGTIVAQRDANGWALRFDGRNGGQEMEFIVSPGWQGDGGFGVPTFEKGEWHYLVGVVDNDKLFLYVDGKLERDMAFGGPMASNGPETEIGHAGDGGFIGIIDEVAIYGKALDEDEVKQNYESKTFAAVNSNHKLAICWGEIKVSR